ncbi:MAG: DUF2914 domain-containing protein [Desulfobacteraceae bacterium]|jgi:hypothetical protein|nr:MAG: DUF2914 domain-containing protein [Desulfobacteraceae bacterium]
MRNFYARYERPISSASLVSGFVFTSLTLTRVDMFLENLWVVAHLLVVAVCIVWINLLENENQVEKDPSKMNFWLVNVLQFVFGGILSTFLVFYFRSADLSNSWPFILLLALAFWANESLKGRFARLNFQISLFYLSVFSFTIFFVPVAMRAIGYKVFLISGAVSLITISLFVSILAAVAWKRLRRSIKSVVAAIAAIFVAINILYFTNIIPPIPLSLIDGGAYHCVEKNAAGNYVVQYEDRGWRGYVTFYPDFHLQAGAPVYVYSAVFSPPFLDTTIVHEWQYKNPKTKSWSDCERIKLPVVGGRNGGFRTYSMKTGIIPGHWRVTVATQKGAVIGRMRFNVVAADTKPPLKTKIND